jgi:sugar porter (SP) family MFS transporter
MLMSGYQTFLQTSALIGFWGAFASNAAFPATSPLQWQIPVAVQLLPGVFLLACTLFIPESPCSLIEHGKVDAAEKSLAWLRKLPVGDRGVTNELRELEETATANESSNSNDSSFFSEAMKPDIRRRLIVGIGLMIAQNMVGLNALNYYAPVIFMSAGFTSVSSSLFLTGVFGLVKLVSAVTFMFVFVRMRGNRYWLKLGSAVCGIAMLVLAYYVRIMPPPDQTHDAKLTIGGIISVLMVYIFAFFFGVSLGPISWNVCSEIFPSHINAKCCSITTCTQWLFQIVIAAMTPHLLASVGWATYVVYAIFCAISFVWVSACVPETRGVPLGRPMDALFDDDLKDEMMAEEVEEVTETTALLRQQQRQQRRRSSIAIPV